jgi:hypothetical protein
MERAMITEADLRFPLLMLGGSVPYVMDDKVTFTLDRGKLTTPLQPDPAVLYIDPRGRTWRKTSADRKVTSKKGWFSRRDISVRTYTLEPGPELSFNEVRAQFKTEVEARPFPFVHDQDFDAEELLRRIDDAESVMELIWIAHNTTTLWPDDPDLAPEHLDKR